ncbi:MotE family protein [Pseudorhodoplanes sp.]|uniref:MotE family protein n=1 Tax=Pseudorhodoplanes sp. TaxID=1934341 RepID=UPI00391A6B77
MSLLFHRLRLVPIVLIAATGLLLLKVAGIIFEGGYTLGAGHQAKTDRALREATVITRPAQTVQPPPPARKPSWAQEMFGYPDVTGSVGAPPQQNGAKPAETKPAETKPAETKPVDPKYAKAPPPAAPAGQVVQLETTPISPSERALLERLAERRAELEKRQSELDMRDTLLKAAEKRLEERLNELKEAEARVVAATQQKEEAELSRLKNLVTMYETMKPKDAAKIFERFDLALATEVAKLIQPRRMSDILSQMTPDAAQKLTAALASRAQSEAKPQQSPRELPKIEGRPSGS